MVNTQLLDYVKQQLAQGIDKETIHHNLLSAGGWNPSDIEEAFSVMGVGAASNIPRTSSGIPTDTVKYAGFWVRFVALIIDNVIVYAGSFVVQLVVGIAVVALWGVTGLFSHFTTNQGVFSGLLYILSILGTVLVTWVYFIVMTNTKGATLGKMALGLKVQSVNGGKLSLGKIITRETIGKILSAIILLIGYMMAGFTQKKQALHDKLAGSVVVYKTDETGSPKHVGKIVLIALIPIIILVAIAVVGILSSVVLVSLNVARQKGADAQVKSVLMQMRTEAEVYYGQNNTYSTTHSCASGMFADPSFTQITSGLKSSTAPTCYAEGSNYAISTPLSTAGQDYCVDSSAFSGNGMATDDGSKASCLAEATSSAAQNLLSSQLQNSQTPTAVTKTNYSYIIPAGWQTVTANASDVEAVDREKKYAFSVQATPLSPQLMYASSIVDVMSADTVKSAIMSESPTIVVDSVNKTTVGGEKAFVTDSHQVPSMSSQSIQQAMVQYNVFHKGSAYTLVFIAPYDSRASAATDIQSIINSFAFKQ